MAQDKKITDLDSVVGLAGTDTIVVVKSGVTYKGTVNDIKAVIEAGNITLAGNFTQGTAGSVYAAKSGANQRAGEATLVGGTVAVSNSTVKSGTIVLLSRKTAGGTVGNLTYTLSVGNSFTINSDNVADTSTIAYFLIDVV